MSRDMGDNIKAVCVSCPYTETMNNFEMSKSRGQTLTVTVTGKDLQRKFNSFFPVDRPRSLNRPILNSYWATPLLLACEYPWSPNNPHKLDALLRSGVRTFIDLTECGELSPYANILCVRSALLGIDATTIEYHRFPIRDRSLPESLDHMYRVLDALRDNEERGRISVVHCRGGIGRTGTVVGCWLVESGIAGNGEEALDIIAREWRSVEKSKRFPLSPETGPQFEYVLNFHPKFLK